jgi:hypothetical protein
MKINIADPTPHELREWVSIVKHVESLGYSVLVVRGANAYGMSTVKLVGDDGVATASAIYPAVPNLGIAQIKADIIAITMCMKDLGMYFCFINADLPKQESLNITRSKLNSCVSVKQVIDLLMETNHERLAVVLDAVEKKRLSGGRPSKKQIIDLVFQGEKKEVNRKPMRSGIEWAGVKNEWRDRFATSKYANAYKSLDEFCTFASDQEVMS